MMKNRTWFLSLALLFFLIFPCLTWAWSGKVVGVTDGDTITVLRNGKQQVKIRLYGIDTPERRQAFGNKAKQFTSGMVFGKVVEIESVDIDRYGRTVAIVKIESLILIEELVRESFAWVYPEFCHRPICNKCYVLSVNAHDAKKGLWVDPNPIPPWEFRRKNRRK